MTLMRRASPLGELVSLRHAMDRLFDDSVVRPRAWGFGGDASTPLPLDISSTAEALIPDKATASFEHGMLHLSIPRAEAVKPRQIRISPTIDGRSTNGSAGSASDGDLTADRPQLDA